MKQERETALNSQNTDVMCVCLRACVCICVCVTQVHAQQSLVLKALRLWDSRAATARTSGFYGNLWQVKEEK